MGTNYYAIKQFSEEEINKIKEKTNIQILIDNPWEYNTNIDWVNEKLQKQKIHLGLQSYGWQFLWNHNNGEYYNLNLSSIIIFLQNMRIYDEYGHYYTIKNFIDNIEHCLFKGELWNHKEYFQKNPTLHYPENKIVILNNGERYHAECGEFTSHGLRFSDTTEFC